MAKISINMKSGELVEEELIVGIDLGTTNSLVAYAKSGKTNIVKDDSGQNSLVPSVIHFNSQGEIIVGEAAKKNLITSPERTIYSVKRLLGKSYTDVKNAEANLSYDIIDQEDQLVKIKIDDVFYSPVSLSAEILKYLKLRIEKHLGRKISKTVITVPAYFNDSQRQATRDAGKLAGLDVLRIINEPTAASLAYGIGLDKEKTETVAVYDLGGGTFDVSILRIEDGVFDVLSTNGDTYLGGDDIDKAILNYWVAENNISKASLVDDKGLNQMLRLRAEEAKKHLSSNAHYKSEDGSFTLDKGTFEALVKPLFDKTINCVEQAVKDADLKVSEIDEVILVGGSTRIPMIKSGLAEYFKKPIYDELNPDEVVAMGAAIQADILAGNTKGFLLIDVTPLSLGIETMGGLMDTIIPRNSKIPVSAGRSYTTSVDGQKNLKVAVYQGERDLVEHNRKLGEFILKDIPPMAAGMPKIEVHFILDADGILKVRASELRSGHSTEVKIKSQYGISEEEMGRMLLDSIKHAEVDMKAKALLEAKNEGRSIVLSSNKFIKQNAEILDPSEIESLHSHMNDLNIAMNGDNKDAINNAMNNLNEFANPLAQRAMDYNIKKALEGTSLKD
ncbi:MAG: molecular chaperone DnaK [Saprospiraceae bacterium]|nr:molecular chaperone DnaK [Saprospiraceae bacterium]